MKFFNLLTITFIVFLTTITSTLNGQSINLSDIASEGICYNDVVVPQNGTLNGKAYFEEVGPSTSLDFVRWTGTHWEAGRALNSGAGPDEIFYLNSADTPQPPCSANLPWTDGPNVSSCTLNGNSTELSVTGDCNPRLATTLFVKHDAMGANNGTSWTDAYSDLSTALSNAIKGDQIWVAAGTYLPSIDNPASDENTNRDWTFYIDKDIAVYGGFNGTETTLEARNPTSNVTNLSGDIGTIDDNTDNVYHVLFIDGTTTNGSITNTCLIDGFTIEKGNATLTAFSETSFGGGIYNNGNGAGNSCSPTISNCIIRNNHGREVGGIANNGTSGESNPNIQNCTFTANSATFGPGAIFNLAGQNGNSSPLIQDCAFMNNTSRSGGGIGHNVGGGGNSSPTIENCIFFNNAASVGGGAIHFSGDGGSVAAQIINCLFQNNGTDHIGYDDGNANTQPHFINCTFSGASSYVVDIEFWDSGQTPIDFTNCIFWGNNNNIVGTSSFSNPEYGDNAHVNIEYSIVEEAAFTQAPFENNNNLNQDPLFVDAANGDFHLQNGSPVINSGNNTAVEGVNSDLEGNNRIVYQQVDMGVYEKIFDCPTNNIIYVNTANPNPKGGDSWANAFSDLQIALEVAHQCTNIPQIWVAAGTYHPSAENPYSPANGNPRDFTFYMNKNIKIYGGFAGTETTLEERNPTTNVTILSGDIGIANDNSDNVLHVLYLDGTTSNGNITNDCVIDGFTIEKGHANGIVPESRGAGIYNKGNGTGNICSPTISQCTFSQNVASESGGAIYNYGFTGTSSPSINHCTFSQNEASEDGGAIYNNGEAGNVSPTINHCTFSENMAGMSGSAIYFLGDDGSLKTQIINCLFQNNGADHIAYDDGLVDMQPHFINCTFSGATQYAINIVFFDSGTTPIDFTNCIFWGNNNDIVGGLNGGDPDNNVDNNLNIQYSIVEEAAFTQVPFENNNNLNQDPLFVDAANGDFHLQNGSPAVDIGNNAAIPAGVLTDLAGETRVFNTTVDAGAYERQTAPLAVNWLDFSAKLIDHQQVQLQWQVANEHKTSHYEVEHSTNGKNFSIIGEVLTEQRTTYQFLDETPQKGLNYYRIRAIEKNGSFTPSVIRNVLVSNVKGELMIYPNPTADRLYFNQHISGNYQILNALGQVVQRGHLSGQQAIEVNKLVVGTYYLNIFSNEQPLMNLKFLKVE